MAPWISEKCKSEKKLFLKKNVYFKKKRKKEWIDKKTKNKIGRKPFFISNEIYIIIITRQSHNLLRSRSSVHDIDFRQNLEASMNHSHFNTKQLKVFFLYYRAIQRLEYNLLDPNDWEMIHNERCGVDRSRLTDIRPNNHNQMNKTKSNYKSSYAVVEKARGDYCLSR